MLLPEIGIEGQRKLAAAKVLVIGAGGLGCAALQYLAAAGVGHIGIADGDVVSVSNLHRQILFGTEDAGSLKVQAAATALHRLNPDVKVKTYPFFLHNVLALELLPKYDIVVDGTDNFSARYMLNDACALLKKPLVYASLSQWEGQIGVLHVAVENKSGINYRDIFPEPPGSAEVPNCAQAGVIGVLPGIMGTMQAAEVIKWITGAGKLLDNGILHFSLKTGTTWLMKVTPQENKEAPADKDQFLMTNYEWMCGTQDVVEIGAKDLVEKITAGALFVDVREITERPELPVAHQRLPLSELRKKKVQLEGREVVLVCHLGIRSIEAARILSQWAPAGQKLYSLKGGIMALAGVALQTNSHE